MFFFFSKILDLAVAPLSWAIALVLVGMWATRRKRARLAFAAPIASAMVLCVFSFGPVANALVANLESSAATTVKPDVTYDAVIVLGGFVDDAATRTWSAPAYSDAVERMLVSYDLLRTGRAKVAILSGASATTVGSEYSEASVIARQLAAWGIAKDRLVVEDRAKNTRENAVESARIIRERGFARVVLVTSAMHMQRAAGCFVAAGVAFDTAPVDFRSHGSRFPNSWLPRADKLDASTYALREHVGRIVYRASGYSAAWP